MSLFWINCSFFSVKVNKMGEDDDENDDDPLESLQDEAKKLI